MITSLRFHLGVCLLVFAGLHRAVFAADPNVIVRQVVIRAPELQVVTALLENPEDDALAKILFQWVDDGTAKIVSQVSDLYGKNETVTVRSGKQFKWVTESDQDLEHGKLGDPLEWEDVFIGTSLEARMLGARRYGNSSYAEAEWKSFFSPRNQENVPWPTWWIMNPERNVNWFQQQDFYVEKVETAAQFVPQGSVILGIMRQADQIEPDPKRMKTLDVVVAQMHTSAKVAPSVPRADAEQPSARSRLTVLGFGVKDHEALDLLSRGDLEHDKSLLDEMLKRAKEGRVTLRMCSAVSQLSGHRALLQTSREHTFPTEMPTIPSAWNTRPVGTIMETDYTFPRSMSISLEHHPALPRFAEWRCALDSPDLVLRQPQFFVQKIQTAFDFGDEGVVLLSAMRTPDYQQGVKGIVPGETLLLFARLDETAPFQKANHGKVVPDGSTVSNDAQTPIKEPSLRMEVEAIVFEVPSNEETKWSLASDGLGDDKRFAQLITRTKDGSAKLVAHIAGVANSGQRTNIATIEEVIKVVEVDEPAPGRCRPTSTNRIPCGTNWEVDAVVEVSKDPLDPDTAEVRLTHQLQHHVAAPIQPEYQKMIEEAIKTKGRSVPQAVLMEETWEGEVKLKAGTARFIGLKHPPGEAFRDKLHLGFVRARVAK
ncbi:hypothetical protein BH11VER1_BH11VER1_03930 [soil metagenome]